MEKEYSIPDHIIIERKRKFNLNKSVKITKIESINNNIIEKELLDYEEITKNKIYKIEFEQKRSKIFSIKDNKVFYYDKKLNLISKGELPDLMKPDFKIFIDAEKVICRKEINEHYEVIYYNSENNKNFFFHDYKLINIIFEENKIKYNLLITSNSISLRKDDGKDKKQIEFLYSNFSKILKNTINLPILLLKYEAFNKFMESELLKNNNFLKKINFKFINNNQFDIISLKNNYIEYSQKNIRIKNSSSEEESILIKSYNKKNCEEVKIKENEDIYIFKLINSQTMLATQKIEFNSKKNKKIVINEINGLVIDENIDSIINILRLSGLNVFESKDLELISLMNDNLYQTIKLKQKEGSKTLTKKLK